MATSADEVRQFPRPPVTFTDQRSRTVDIEAYDGDPSPLVAMYAQFDHESRAQGVPPRGERQIREWVETLLAEGLNVVVWHDETAVGHAVLIPEGESSELAIFVHPEYQSAGIGTRLIEVLLGHGQANGLDHVWLAVERTNHVAMKLYDGVGFETRLRDRAEHEMERPL
ncbi:GNAT family N-acetyltransferase [Haloarcula nitratireducens]|uniref:GNAT family N-acetyltransferase n=1 Tax=Haloarcula nitratireducens TaxID=2487749 RepID=A0AAW4PFA5_9EURY|nr:GNAT family N-acetyltransferase [Halomicroarcula nitratireducens]MBX0296298.1 GNAT family N-acetyltransferase [Halomicroarcula nitratireducens]